MADKIWATIEEPIRRQIEKRQRLMLQNSNYKERVTYLNKKCDIRVTPLSYDTRESYENEYKSFFFNNDYIENTFASSSYKSKTERPFIENFELISRTGANDKVGVLRTGKMSIKIFTKDQFNKIEKYFRIGSALLIEWGWSNYVSNGGNTGYFNTHLYPNIETKMLNEKDILEHIKDHTLKSNGNYDGAIMFINNFSINFENGVNDFYYTLNVDFIGKSLLMNELFGNKAENNDQTTDDTNKIFSNPLVNLLRFIETIENETSLNDYETIGTISLPSSIDAPEETQNTITLNLRDILNNNKTDINEIKNAAYFPFTQSPQIIQSYTFLPPVVNQDNNVPQIRIIKDKISTAIYSYNFISLEYFLELLSNLISIKYEHLDQKYIITEYALTSIRTPTASPPPNNIINLGVSEVNFVDEGARETPFQNTISEANITDILEINSFDTRICILPHQLTDNNTETNIKDINLRATYLKDLLISLLRSNEDFTLNNILSKILDDINRVTTNELKLEYISNDENGTYTIISNSSSRTGVTNINDLLSLKIYNKSAVGSIVEEVNIDTTIDSKIANTIAIASLGQPLNEIPNESFGLLKFNKNIKSRLNIENILLNSDEKSKILERLNKNFFFLNSNISELLNFTKGSINFDKDDTFIELINAFKQIRTDVINLSIIDKNVDALPRNTPLIPVLYNFSIPGISGLYITNLLKIEDKRLPDIYQTSNSYYIITGITHTINNREWKTSVKTNFQLS
jgi:hypothetical protein